MIVKVSGVKSVDNKKDPKNKLEALWLNLRNGDQQSLSKLFCITYPWLFNYGYKIVPQEAFVKDAIQDLFLRLWNKRQTIGEAKSVKAYLFSSLRRIIFRKLEKKQNRTERNHCYHEYEFEEVYNIEELLIHFETDEEKKNQFVCAMQSLNKRHKEAIYLKFNDGLTNEEIAQVMQINKQSVYNYMSEAIGSMQEFVKQ